MNPLRLYFVLLALHDLCYTTVAQHLKSITIPDAGRGFKIGELYDIRKDEVIRGAYLWKDVEKNILRTKAPYVSLDFKKDMSFASRLELLSVSLSASIKLLFIKLHGSVDVIKEKRSTAKSVRIVARYKTRNRHETINAVSNKLINEVNEFEFGVDGTCPNSAVTDEQCTPATHFVSAITYGADVFVSFEEAYRYSSDRDKIKAKFVGLNIFDYDNIAKQEWSNTAVTFNGDFNLGEKKPSTVEETIDFIQRLPQIAIDEVPMDIVLTPLSFLKEDFPVPTIPDIDDNILRRVTNVFDGLDMAEGHILDVMAIEPQGFLVWYEYLEKYYNDFLEYQVTLMATMKNAIESVKSGIDDQSIMNTIVNEYNDRSNPYNEYSVRDECENRQNTIKSLHALTSEFDAAGITFAATLADYEKSTVDIIFDRVYVLVLVGLHPKNHRNDLPLLHSFIDLAKKRLRPRNDKVIEHCLWTQRADETVCSSGRHDFVVIHFDSFCGNLCNSKFCPLAPEEPELCPANATRSPCDYSDESAHMDHCTSNKYTGSCYTDSANNNVAWTPGAAMNPAHSIDKKENPLSDCWCSCPKTQIMQYVRPQKPVRLDEEDMPRVPPKPVIAEITGTTEAEMEPFGYNQRIILKMTDNPDTLRFRVTLDHLLPTTDNNGEVSFVNEEESFLTLHSDPIIHVPALAAGQIYSVSVAGVNSLGEGESSDIRQIQVGHRMVDYNVGTTTERNITAYNGENIQSWLNVYVALKLSTTDYDNISRVTIHEDFIGQGSVDVVELVNENSIFVECNLLANVPNSTSDAYCLITGETNEGLEADKMMEIRVWDDTDLLIAKNEVNMLKGP